jgi:ornithine lipid ester-linked acyl 2-hydroxylase
MSQAVSPERNSEGPRVTMRERIGAAAFSLAKRIVWGLDAFFARHSTVGDRAFFNVEDFDWAPAVEADWRKVRADLDALLPHAAHLPNFQDLSADQRHLTQDDCWKTFFFYAYGLRARSNCRRCPETAALLRRIPGMKTAFFSIFAPGKRLPPHRGPYKGVLRLHLALLVPEPREHCGLRVDGEVRHWEEGRLMIFDDTFEHEAWNESDGMRVVLFVDIVRPMRFPANLLNGLMIWLIALSPFVLGSAGSYARWEKRFESIVNSGEPAAASTDNREAGLS